MNHITSRGESKSYEESWNEMLKKLARNIAYELTLKNGEEKKSVWEYDIDKMEFVHMSSPVK